MRRDNATFRNRYGEWAVITGGSEGIGAEFARKVAERGLNLVLVARRREVLERFSSEVRSSCAVAVTPIVLDLALRQSVDELVALTRDLPVGLLVCSAASSPLGYFLENPAADHDRLLDLNCRVPALLSWELGRRMAARERGGIILMSSMASFQGTGYVAHYAASKAYVRVLAEGLWNELHGHGIDVVASCPGMVRTPTLFDGHPVHPGSLASPLMDCEPVVRETLAALGKGPVIIPGRANRISSWIAQRLLPRRAAISLASAGTKAIYPTRSLPD